MASEAIATMCDSRIMPRAGDAKPAVELILRARGGERNALEQIIREHERQVMNVAWRMLGSLEDAEDAAQEVFLSLSAGGLVLPAHRLGRSCCASG